MSTTNYQVLIDKLDAFIRKYYKNQLIRGLIYSVAVLLLFYLAVTILEYYAHFNTVIRTILFYAFILCNAYILAKLVVIPLFKLNKLGKRISHEQAAGVIGKYFSEVSDKLLNTLQLNKQLADGPDNQLVYASIEQRIREIKPIPFTAAIDLSQNVKYLKYALGPLLLFFILLYAAPHVLRDGTKRLVEHETFFARQAPFQFVIQNKDLKAVQQSDYKLNVKITGDDVPDNVFIDIGGNEYKLQKNNTVNFSYLFKNLQKSVHFQLAADGFKSSEYKLNVLPNPVLLDFKIALDYPKYTGKKDEVIQNTGDLTIPQGTKVHWQFNTQNSSVLRMSFNDTSIVLKPQDNGNVYSYSKRLMHDKTYSVTTANQFVKSQDSVIYSINVIPDLYPSIEVEQQPDSMSSKRIYFRGDIKDDYGFTKLTFNYRFVDHSKGDSLHKQTAVDNNKNPLFTVNIPITKNTTEQQFYHMWDMTMMTISPGDEIEYYFQVWDNDAVNGSKSSKSKIMYFNAPTLDQIEANTENNNNKVKTDLSNSIEQARNLQRQMENERRNLLEKKNLTWEDRKRIKDLLEKQKELQNKVDNIQKENEKNMQQQSEYKKQDAKIAQQEQEIQKLMKTVIPPELRKKMEELQKLLDKMNKNQVQQAMNQMHMNNKDLQKELERTLELFKQMEFQQKLTTTIQQVDSLAKKQNKLGDKSLKSKKSADQALKQSQDSLNKQFQAIRKDMQDLQKKNSQLEQPNNFKNNQQQQEAIQQQMQKSSQQLSQKRNKKASQSQKDAAQKMQQMGKSLAAMQSHMESQQQMENINSLRLILDNLLQLSFDQEALMKKLRKTETSNPQYVVLTQKQKDLQDDSKMIEDSLQALGKRAPSIQHIVTREINSIDMNMGKAIAAMADRETFEATNRQQYAMTSTNNLALLLSEVFKQMQQQMQSKMGGSGSCHKPGGSGSKPSLSSLKKMQDQLNKEIAKMKQALDQKGNKPGQKMGKGDEGMSEQLAKLAAQQEAIREAVQQAEDRLNKNNQGGGKLGNIAKQMEKTEKDIVNREITESTLKRQQEIITRLLESEKAEKQQGMDPKRIAHTAKKQFFGNPKAFFEYKRLKTEESELLKTVPPSLAPYYRKKVNRYFNNFGEQSNDTNNGSSGI